MKVGVTGRVSNDSTDKVDARKPKRTNLARSLRPIRDGSNCHRFLRSGPRDEPYLHAPVKADVYG
jgi:hypothetical protein